MSRATSEVISLLIECLHAIGLGHLRLLSVTSDLSSGSSCDPASRRKGKNVAEQAAAKKDLPRLEEVLASERIAKSMARSIREAPDLTARRKCLERGRILAAGEPILLAPLDRLAQVYHLLCAAGHRDSLLLDLGEFRGFDYYDGVVFDVFASGVGAELGGGGRYDHLIGRFGRDLPSTGFALDVDRLFRAVGFPQADADGARIDYVVAGPRRSMRLIIDIAKKLRGGHRRVVQQLVKGSDASAYCERTGDWAGPGSQRR